MVNYRSPGEIARARAEAAGRPDDWQDFLPLEDGTYPEVQPGSQASRSAQPEWAAPQAAREGTVCDPSVVLPPAEDRDRPAKDAKRLYTVAEAIYTMLIIFNWVIGIGGGLMALGWFIGATTERREPAVWVYAGVVTLLITGIICLFNYAVAVLSTHVAKVLSNISLSLLDRH
jgi:hypothetical protein